MIFTHKAKLRKLKLEYKKNIRIKLLFKNSASFNGFLDTRYEVWSGGQGHVFKKKTYFSFANLHAQHDRSHKTYLDYQLSLYLNVMSFSI